MLHPFAMARYDRLRSDGTNPLDAMREAVLLFGLDPHARPAPSRSPVAISAPAADAAPEPGITDGVSSQPAPEPDPYEDTEHRGRRIAERLQAQALYERGAPPPRSPWRLRPALIPTAALLRWRRGRKAAHK